MKKILPISVAVLSLGTGSLTLADDIHNWEVLQAAKQHVWDATQELERAGSAHHYDSSGHAQKAEDLLQQAMKELGAAVEAAKAGH